MDVVGADCSPFGEPRASRKLPGQGTHCIHWQGATFGGAMRQLGARLVILDQKAIQSWDGVHIGTECRCEWSRSDGGLDREKSQLAS